MSTTARNRLPIRKKSNRLAIALATSVLFLIVGIIVTGMTIRNSTPITFNPSFQYTDSFQLEAVVVSPEEEIHPLGVIESERVLTLANNLIATIQRSTSSFSLIQDHENWMFLETVHIVEVDGFANQEQGDYIVAALYYNKSHTIYVNELLFGARGRTADYLIAHELMHAVFPVGFDFMTTKGYGVGLNEGFTDLAVYKVFGEFRDVNISYPVLRQIAKQLEFVYGDEIWIHLANGCDEAIQRDFDSHLREGDWIRFNQSLDAFDFFSRFPDQQNQEIAELLLSSAQELMCNYFAARVSELEPVEQHRQRRAFKQMLIWTDDQYFLNILGL